MADQNFSSRGATASTVSTPKDSSCERLRQELIAENRAREVAADAGGAARLLDQQDLVRADVQLALEGRHELCEATELNLRRHGAIEIAHQADADVRGVVRLGAGGRKRGL